MQDVYRHSFCVLLADKESTFGAPSAHSGPPRGAWQLIVSWSSTGYSIPSQTKGFCCHLIGKLC